MATVAVLAGTPKFYVNDLCGRPAVGGFFFTTDTLTGYPKPTYSDPALTIPNPTKMEIGSDGAVENIMYFAVTEGEPLYTIAAFDASGAPIYSYPNFPGEESGGGGGDIYISLNAVNFGRNEQFAFWNRGVSFSGDTLPVGTTEVADEWYFRRSNDTANVTISKYDFPAGSTDYDFTPTSAFRYAVSVAASDSVNDVGQKYQSVQTLNGQQVTVVFGSNTLNVGQTAPVSLYCRQNFGVGGSPDVNPVINTFTINDTADTYSATFNIPSVGGKTIGVDSYLEIGFRFNPNVIQDVIITNYQFQQGEGTGQNFPYITEDEQYVKILPDVLSGYSDTQGTNEIGWSEDQTLKQYLIAQEISDQRSNILIGWNFLTNPNQMGFTIPSIVSGTYIADQTILLSDGNGVVGKSLGIGSPLTLTVETASKKFGIFQIIENNNSAYLQGAVVSLLNRIEADATVTCKMAVLKWSGTSNQQARNAVQAWNAAGVNPTLATGWSYDSEVASFTVGTGSYDIFNKLEKQTLSTGISSFGVFIWVDSADLPVNDTIRFVEASLNLGNTATRAQTLDFETVLLQCQRYYATSYDIGQFAGAINTFNSFGVNIQTTHSLGTNPSIYPVTVTGVGSISITVYVSSQYFTVSLPVVMYKTPTMSFYDSYTGASNTGTVDVRAINAASVSSQLVQVSPANQGNTRFFSGLCAGTSIVLSNSPGSGSPLTIQYAQNLQFNYIANATLGV